MANTYNKLSTVLEEYSNRLNKYTEETFLKKSKEDVWCPAEVYAHILSANRLTIKGMHKALAGEATLDNGGLSWKTKLIFLMGRIPAGRKVPEVIKKRTPIYSSKIEAEEALRALKVELAEIWDKRASWTVDQKLKHPALGLLNNTQWMKFLLIHSKHHIKQLDRIS